ncbi:MAG: hypothetical protein IPP07_10800 [Holophagales bacterium]|nr:hypothetical protein [Holophagales bacterium]
MGQDGFPVDVDEAEPVRDVCARAPRLVLDKPATGHAPSISRLFRDLATTAIPSEKGRTKS